MRGETRARQFSETEGLENVHFFTARVGCEEKIVNLLSRDDKTGRNKTKSGGGFQNSAGKACRVPSDIGAFSSSPSLLSCSYLIQASALSHPGGDTADDQNLIGFETRYLFTMRATLKVMA